MWRSIFFDSVFLWFAIANECYDVVRFFIGTMILHSLVYWFTHHTSLFVHCFAVCLSILPLISHQPYVAGILILLRYVHYSPKQLQEPHELLTAILITVCDVIAFLHLALFESSWMAWSLFVVRYVATLIADYYLNQELPNALRAIMTAVFPNIKLTSLYFQHWSLCLLYAMGLFINGWSLIASGCAIWFIYRTRTEIFIQECFITCVRLITAESVK